MNDGAWSWAESSGERAGAVALTERLRGGDGDAAIACASAGVGEAGKREQAAGTVAGACLRRLAEGGGSQPLDAATAAANEALCDNEHDVNRGATLCAATIESARLRWHTVGDGVVYHIRRLTGEIELCNEPARINGLAGPAAALMGMPHGGNRAPRGERRLASGDVVIIGTGALGALEHARIVGALTRDEPKTNAAERLLAAAEAETAPGTPAAVACYTLPGEAAAAAETREPTISGNRARGDEFMSRGRAITPKASRRIKNISPGFGWGYEGRAPNQLALAILFECTSRSHDAKKWYERFAREHVATIHAQHWEMTVASVVEWLDARKTEQEEADKVEAAAAGTATNDERATPPGGAGRRDASRAGAGAGAEGTPPTDRSREAGLRQASTRPQR